MDFEESSEEILEKQARGRFLLALTLSLMIVLGSMAWTCKIGLENNKLYHHWSHVQEAIEGFSHGMKAASAK